MTRLPFLAGAAAALSARELVRRALLVKFRRDVVKLDRGDSAPLLKAFADDAVLHFNPGAHRWAGEHRGKPAIARFLENYTRARVQGRIEELWIGGPPWRLSMAVRFDDYAEAGDGTRIYENRTCLVLRTRWGKIVDQEDFYVDTTKILDFDAELERRGVAPVGSGHAYA